MTKTNYATPNKGSKVVSSKQLIPPPSSGEDVIERFFNTKAKKFQKLIKKLTSHCEQGFQAAHNPPYDFIDLIVALHGWDKFTTHPVVGKYEFSDKILLQSIGEGPNLGHSEGTSC
ncbi:hypothetical protein V6N13_036817 [Hibiscus sabdariffa]